MLETIYLQVISRMEHGFGRLEEGQVQNRMASEARSQELQRQIHEIKVDVRELRTKIETKAATSILSFGSVASALISHWQIVATIILIISGLIMGKSPETIKAWLKALG